MLDRNLSAWSYLYFDFPYISSWSNALIVCFPLLVICGPSDSQDLNEKGGKPCPGSWRLNFEIPVSKVSSYLLGIDLSREVQFKFPVMDRSLVKKSKPLD